MLLIVGLLTVALTPMVAGAPASRKELLTVDVEVGIANGSEDDCDDGFRDSCR